MTLKQRKSKRPPEKKLTGARRMKELGYKQVQIWLDPSELAAIQKAFPKVGLAKLARRLMVEGSGLTFRYR
jgi:hypothetical protein